MTAFNKDEAFEIPCLKEGAKWGFSVSFKPEGDKTQGYRYVNKHPIIGIHEINRWEGSPRGYSPRMRPLNPRQKEKGTYNAHIFLQPADLPELISLLTQIIRMFGPEIDTDELKRAEYEVRRRTEQAKEAASIVDASEFGMNITGGGGYQEPADSRFRDTPAVQTDAVDDADIYGSEFGGDSRQKNTRPPEGREPGDDGDDPPF